MSTFIHVGYRKTGTSWLQDLLFPRLLLNYIGKNAGNYPRWLIEWHYADDFHFRSELVRIRRSFEETLRLNQPNLISSEAFTNTAVICSQAERIKAVCPNARIIVTLRDPVDMVWSHYMHDISEGDCFARIEDWLDWTRTPFVLHKRKTIYLPDFFFDEAVNLYTNLFGADNVCVLKFEDMIRRKDRFFGELFQFLGIACPIPDDALLATKVNESSGVAQRMASMRWANFVQTVKCPFPVLFEELSQAPAHRYCDHSPAAMPEDMRKKLAEYFAGKAHGYY